MKSPWTDEQVKNLNAFQACGFMHPFTCGNDQCRCDLTATNAGWVCPRCDYTQDWAHDFMASGEWTDLSILGRHQHTEGRNDGK